MLTTSNTALSSLRPLPASLARRPFVCCPGAVHDRSHLHQPIATRAKLGGGGEGDKESSKKGFISAEEEPDEFFITKAESAGGLAPLKDPIAIVGILGILLPFVILGIAIATGYVDTAPRATKF
ncbi:hypothetical protein WJX82_006170 [Trebouxia sp. C0006]